MPLRVALAHQEHDRRGVRRAVVRQARLPVGRQQLALGRERVDVVGERQRDDVGGQAVDHRARLLARAAVRLADRDVLAGLLLPVLREGLVVVVVQLARRVVRDVEQRRLAARSAGASSSVAASSAAPPGDFRIRSIVMVHGLRSEAEREARQEHFLVVAVCAGRGAAFETRLLVVEDPLQVLVEIPVEAQADSRSPCGPRRPDPRKRPRRPGRQSSSGSSTW